MNSSDTSITPASASVRRPQFWLVAKRCCQIAGSVDVAFFFLFYILGSPLLAWVNVISVSMYILAYQALARRRNRLAITLISEPNQHIRVMIGALMVQTGRVDVVPWLLDQWRADSELAPWVADKLVEVGRHDRSQVVRDAFDSMLRGFGGTKPDETRCSRLLLAWLSMGDPRALDFVAVGAAPGHVQHPYASSKEAQLSPIQYLMYTNPDPPHGFTVTQIVATVKRCPDLDPDRNDSDPRRFSVPAIMDEALAAIAERNGGDWDSRNWREHALYRLAGRLERQRASPALEGWFLSELGVADLPTRWFHQVPESVTRHYRDRIAAVIDGDDEQWARLACWALEEASIPLDVDQLLQNRHARVRHWAVQSVRDGRAEVAASAMIARLADDDADVRTVAAAHLGAVVAKDAVPALIERLRDPDAQVRQAAADALTRIRFYHEQQAHWDRVLKGLDASAASSAEKLLLQAKPGAQREQRLLAIQSLGVLGVPEALPFLIEWTQDTDTDIASAAKAAITKIHLEPRK
jgi:hypothetical protein